MDLYFWKITEVPSRGTVLMSLEQIPGAVTQGDSLPLALSKTVDSNGGFFEHRAPQIARSIRFPRTQADLGSTA